MLSRNWIRHGLSETRQNIKRKLISKERKRNSDIVECKWTHDCRMTTNIKNNCSMWTAWKNSHKKLWKKIDHLKCTFSSENGNTHFVAGLWEWGGIIHITDLAQCVALGCSVVSEMKRSGLQGQGQHWDCCYDTGRDQQNWMGRNR